MTTKLVNITAYAKHWGIARSTVYDLIDRKIITRFESPEGEPLLNIEEHPKGVQKHGDRKRKIV